MSSSVFMERQLLLILGLVGEYSVQRVLLGRTGYMLMGSDDGETEGQNGDGEDRSLDTMICDVDSIDIDDNDMENKGH